MSSTGRRGIFTMPALDGVHQAEVAHQPRERAVPRDGRCRRCRTAWPTGPRIRNPRPVAVRVQLLIRSRPSTQTVASSALLLQRPRRSSAVELRASRGAGRQQWCPSSFSTMIGIRSYRSSRAPAGRRSPVSPVPCSPRRRSCRPPRAPTPGANRCQFVTSTLPLLQQRAVLHRHNVELGVVVLRISGRSTCKPFLHGQVRAADQDGVRETPCCSGSRRDCRRPRRSASPSRPSCRCRSPSCSPAAAAEHDRRIRRRVDQRREEVGARSESKPWPLAREEAAEIVIRQWRSS